ncbi:unnamed protein product [Strongylus vulgaris]|uniref:Uncharacterized protein n=1 Tax=Strongylus vulgaris TaxID=40348 RepID=A0A3P7JFI8_STRVU|nr:unnamed protein product [Strongylus vulgaris]
MGSQSLAPGRCEVPPGRLITCSREKRRGFGNSCAPSNRQCSWKYNHLTNYRNIGRVDLESTHTPHSLSLPKEHHIDEYLNPDWGATPSRKEYPNLPAVVEMKDNERMKEEERLNDLAKVYNRLSRKGANLFVGIINIYFFLTSLESLWKIFLF